METAQKLPVPMGMAWEPEIYDAGCRLCPRLAGYLAGVRRRHPDYFARPVGPFGAARPRLLIVGLAPGLHGANATGRPFTGDFAGLLLYRTLHAFGLASRPVSTAAGDGLRLHRCRISNAVKCVPPANRPSGEEVRTCNRYLGEELRRLDKRLVILALGRVAHEAVLRAQALRSRGYPFAHGAVHVLPGGRRLVDSYHCSRYNTQTGRLTEAMFRQAVGRAVKLLPPAGRTRARRDR